MRLVADDAQLRVGSPTNAGSDASRILAGLSLLSDRFTIEDNRITNLDGYSDGSEAGVVHLACFTDAGSGYVRSRWHVRVEPRGDRWQIVDLTWISFNGNPPTWVPR